MSPELRIVEYVDRKVNRFELSIGGEIIWSGDSPPDAEIEICNYKRIPVPRSVLNAKALWDARRR